MDFKIEYFDTKSFNFDYFGVLVTGNSIEFFKKRNGVPSSILVPSIFRNELSNVHTKISNVYFTFECWEKRHEKKLFETIAFIFDIEL